MSELRIEERFRLDAPPEVVWRFLIDPAMVAACLPGAALDGREDERTYRGSMRVAVGPVSVSYAGTVRFEEVDHEARRVRMTGSGREATGSGSATLDMESRVAAGEDGGAEVIVESRVQVTGKMVRFGRGMLGRVSEEVFRDFTACVAARLEAPHEGGRPAGAEAAPPDGDAAVSAPIGPGAAGETEPARGLVYLWRAFVRWLADLLRRSREGDPPRMP